MAQKQKKLKVKKKSVLILVGIILLLLLINPTISFIRLAIKGYSVQSSFEIMINGGAGSALDKKYSKTLNNIASTKYFSGKKVKKYLSIDYYDYKDFNKNVSSWLKLGYSAEDINEINKKKDDVLINLSSNNYVENITEYLKVPYFKSENLLRYNTYFTGNYEDTVIDVNIGIDKGYYNDPVIVSEFSYTMLVNKYNKLDDNFVPTDLTELTKCSGKKQYLAGEAKLAYDELCDASLKDGMHLGITSSYRSHEDQEDTYDEEVRKKGKEYADEYVAQPGFSEHETGLTIDVKSTEASPFRITKEYQWMLENAYKYGFILRYPKGKETKTGYEAEEWHFRYVGKEIAAYIQENDITYEEYCAMFF